MFGLLRARGRLARQAYTVCCRTQHHRYGATSLAWLSHEASWLYLLAIEAGAAPRPGVQSPTCCRLRARPGDLPRGSTVANFCAALGLRLAAAKLEDDVRDELSFRARAWRWWLRRPLAAVRAELAELDPELEAELARGTRAQLALEGSSDVSLDQWCEPTAKAMSRLFGLVPAAPAVRELAAKVGSELGSALVALDCARDWWADARARRPNPLRSAADVDAARSAGRAALGRAAVACRAFLGGRSEAAAVLDEAALDRRAVCAHGVRERLSAWGFVARPGAVLARFDCCCDACACDCCCGAADVGGCCQCGECACGCADCFACDCCAAACPGPSPASLPEDPKPSGKIVRTGAGGADHEPTPPTDTRFSSKF